MARVVARTAIWLAALLIPIGDLASACGCAVEQTKPSKQTGPSACCKQARASAEASAKKPAGCCGKNGTAGCGERCRCKAFGCRCGQPELPLPVVPSRADSQDGKQVRSVGVASNPSQLLLPIGGPFHPGQVDWSVSSPATVLERLSTLCRFLI